jgi:hypothetical protein
MGVSECEMDTDDDGIESVEAMLISPSLVPEHNHGKLAAHP